jgi:hypothetical protein
VLRAALWASAVHYLAIAALLKIYAHIPLVVAVVLGVLGVAGKRRDRAVSLAEKPGTLVAVRRSLHGRAARRLLAAILAGALGASVVGRRPDLGRDLSRRNLKASAAFRARRSTHGASRTNGW